jgi:uncharacterized protein YjdB
MRRILLTVLAIIAMFIAGKAQTVSITGNQFTVNGKQIFFNGINVPWHNWADFGGNFVQSWWTSEFQRYVDNKINLARVWIHCNGMNSPTTSSSGSVSGASAQFWANMDTLIAISRAKKVYIMPCLWSFDMVKNTNTSTYQQFRNLINSQANIQTYIDNFLIPLVKRYPNEPYLLAWEICNEPEWMFENAEDGPIPIVNVQRLHAMCAAAIHKNSPKFVTTGSACVKWNSYLYQNSGDNAGNVWGDTTLQRIYNDPQAKLDFWQIHWYPWMSQWFQSPYQKTTAAFKIDDKPVIVGESQGLDQCDSYICMTLTQMYENAYVNGFDGVCGWKTPQNDGYGTFENIAVATNAFYNNHAQLVYPSGTAISVTGVTVAPTTASISVNGTAQLAATVAPANATNKTVNWSSSNTAVATVSATGLVTGVAAGNATITATTQDGAKTATCAVTVTNTTVSVTGVTVSPATASINVGGTSQLAATVSPANATNKTVSWSSSNTAVATVSATGLVTGVAAGNTTITVTTQDGAKTATCAVTVTSGNSCTFGTPLATALPTIANKSYSHAYVIGTGGPNLSNVNNFTINWDLPNKGLWQFSMNTSNGIPSWWINFLPMIKQTFASASPACTLTGTGITGLDGDYWVNIDGANFVMVAKSGAFVLYFTNGTAPTCTKSAFAPTGMANGSNEISFYPNPVDKNSTLTLNLATIDAKGAQYYIADINGKVVTSGIITNGGNKINLNGAISCGVYILRIINGTEQQMQKLIVK